MPSTPGGNKEVRIVTPPAPLHGPKFDTYEPYSVRKSPRIQSRRVARTPSPTGRNTDLEEGGTVRKRVTNAPRNAVQAVSPPSSPIYSPRRSTRKSFQSPDTLEYNSSNKDQKQKTTSLSPYSSQLSTVHLHGVYPTPAKTPRKKYSHAQVSASTSRALFPSSFGHLPSGEPVSSPSLRRFTMKSRALQQDLTDEDVEHEDFQIFQDMKDRVPTADPDPSQPFYDGPKPHTKLPSTPEAAPSRRSTRPKSAPTPQDYGEMVRSTIGSNRGMIYTFRGKKIFKPFSPEDDTPPGGQDLTTIGGQTLDETEPPRRNRGRGIKPRRLFRSPFINPTAHPDATGSDDDAPTDLDEAAVVPVGVEIMDEPAQITPTPLEKIKDKAKPPKVAAAATSPTTRRTTRSTLLRPSSPAASDSELEIVKKRVVSDPFVDDPRDKTQTTRKASNKRKLEADNVEPEAQQRKPSKRVRTSAVHNSA